MVVLILLLLLAAALGVLGTVLKVTLVLVMSFGLAIVILGIIGYYYARHRFRRFVKTAEQQQRMPPGGRAPGGAARGGAGGGGQRGYPTTGTKSPPPQLPE